MPMTDLSFCVFIISHGRASNVKTLQTLKRGGYTGPIFIIIDNEDKHAQNYHDNFGINSVIVFDKQKYAQLVDSCDNFQNRRTTTHARNACFDIASEKGFQYFLVLDDDYTRFKYTFDRSGLYNSKHCTKLGLIFNAVAKMLDTDHRILSICFLQAGDLIGGIPGDMYRGRYPFDKRKAMNSFFCKTDRRFWYFSRLNEDVNTYMTLGARGAIFLSIPGLALIQMQTQANAGGMSDAYLASGTYVKSFYTVMNCPSFCKIEKQRSVGRLHHKITWNNAIPKIINDIHKK
jgi:hypothetical protein